MPREDFAFSKAKFLEHTLVCYAPLVASDPSPEYLETLRKMDGVEKLKAAGRLFWSARRWKAAAIREKHPNWSEEEVHAEVSRIILHASD